MPELDGYAATRAIRGREAQRDEVRTPILALTANALAGDAERCLAAGMDGYLPKPLRADDLEAALVRWIGPKAPPTEPAIDEGVLTGLRVLGDDDGQAFVADLSAMFLDDVPAKIDALRTAVLAGDSTTIYGAAHGLKGSCATMGAIEMARLCGQLEQKAEESGASAGMLLDSLDAEFVRVRLRLQAVTAASGVR